MSNFVSVRWLKTKHDLSVTPKSENRLQFSVSIINICAHYLLFVVLPLWRLCKFSFHIHCGQKLSWTSSCSLLCAKFWNVFCSLFSYPGSVLVNNRFYCGYSVQGTFVIIFFIWSNLVDCRRSVCTIVIKKGNKIKTFIYIL